MAHLIIFFRFFSYVWGRYISFVGAHANRREGGCIAQQHRSEHTCGGNDLICRRWKPHAYSCWRKNVVPFEGREKKLFLITSGTEWGRVWMWPLRQFLSSGPFPIVVIVGEHSIRHSIPLSRNSQSVREESITAAAASFLQKYFHLLLGCCVLRRYDISKRSCCAKSSASPVYKKQKQQQKWE